MSCLGVVLSKTEVQKMMDEADIDRDGQLNYKGKLFSDWTIFFKTGVEANEKSQLMKPPKVRDVEMA